MTEGVIHLNTMQLRVRQTATNLIFGELTFQRLIVILLYVYALFDANTMKSNLRLYPSIVTPR